MGAGLPSKRSVLPMYPKHSYSRPQASWIQFTAIPMDHRGEQLQPEVLRLPVVQRPGEERHLDLYVTACWVLAMYLVLFLLPHH